MKRQRYGFKYGSNCEYGTQISRWDSRKVSFGLGFLLRLGMLEKHGSNSTDYLLRRYFAHRRAVVLRLELAGRERIFARRAHCSASRQHDHRAVMTRPPVKRIRLAKQCNLRRPERT